MSVLLNTSGVTTRGGGMPSVGGKIVSVGKFTNLLVFLNLIVC